MPEGTPGPELAIVLPVYNEGDAVEPVLRALNRSGGDLTAEYDRVFGLVPCKECPPFETEYHRGTEPFFRAQQLADVAGEARRLVDGVDLPASLSEALVAAAVRHDLGKADPRFQALLRGSSIDLVWMQPRLWAKSARGGITGQRFSSQR